MHPALRAVGALLLALPIGCDANGDEEGPGEPSSGALTGGAGSSGTNVGAGGAGEPSSGALTGGAGSSGSSDSLSAENDDLTVMTYSDGWAEGEAGEHYTSTVGATASFTFTGTEFVLYGVQDAHHGDMEIRVDDARVATISQANAARATNVKLYASEVLPQAEHTVELRCASHTVTYDRAEVFGSPVALTAKTYATDEQFSQTRQYLSSNNDKTTKNYWVEHGGLDITPVEEAGGLLSLRNNTHTNGYKGKHRGFSTRRYDCSQAPGRSIRYQYRARATSFSVNEFNHTIAGVNIGMKWPKDPGVTGFQKDDPNSVKGYGLAGPESYKNPYNCIFRVGFNPDGHVELMIYDGASYVQAKRVNVPYSAGTWRDITVQIDNTGPSSMRVRYWHSHDVSQAPVLDWSGATPGGVGWSTLGPGYIWYRTDYANFDYDFMSVQEL